MEFGPYIYQETDTYDDVSYEKAFNPNTGQNESAVFATYTQDTKFKEDTDGYLDEDMYLLNQVTLATWYRVNHSPPWQNYMTILYSVVLDCLGR